MFVYDLAVTMSKKNVPLETELINAIKEAISIANNSFSAIRYQRTIEYVNQIDDYRMHLRMKSKDSINPTRSLSSLSRALVKNENTKGSTILENYIYNGSVFLSKTLGSSEEVSSHISDTKMVQEIISMVFNQKTMNNRDKDLSKECTEAIRNIVIDYINNKTDNSLQ